MVGYINRDIGYYEGDKAFQHDLTVPKRPSPDYKYDEETNEWVIDDEKIKAKEKEQAIVDLETIDKGAIRAILECLAEKFPEFKWSVDGKDVSFTSLLTQKEVTREKLG